MSVDNMNEIIEQWIPRYVTRIQYCIYKDHVPQLLRYKFLFSKSMYGCKIQFSAIASFILHIHGMMTVEVIFGWPLARLLHCKQSCWAAELVSSQHWNTKDLYQHSLSNMALIKLLIWKLKMKRKFAWKVYYSPWLCTMSAHRVRLRDAQPSTGWL